MKIIIKRTNKPLRKVRIVKVFKKIDYRTIIGDDCWNMILDMKYETEHKERMVKLNHHFKGFMKGRYVDYKYIYEDKCFMVDDCGWSGYKWISERNGKFIIQGFLNKVNQRIWNNWVDYKYSKKMLGCERTIRSR